MLDLAPGRTESAGGDAGIARSAREAFALSWKSLGEVGNLSSASVLLVLKETIESRRPEPGRHGLVIAMGPGFCSELVLLRF